MQINGGIRDKEVRLIDVDGSQLGILSSREALKLAVEKNLDLVKIAPQANPAVCRIMDYGKFKFEQSKRDKEARKNQKTIDMKEIRMSVNIGDHDFDTKLKNAVKFLTSGDKVKVSVRFRGREMAHIKLGHDLLEKFKQACSEYGQVDNQAKLEGRNLSMFISSKPTK